MAPPPETGRHPRRLQLLPNSQDRPRSTRRFHVGQAGVANPSCEQSRHDEFERLSPRAIAGVDIQLHTVCCRGSRGIQAKAAALAYKLVVTIAQRHCLPFLVGVSRIGPQLYEAAIGGAIVDDIPGFVRSIAVGDVIIAIARGLELPLLIVLVVAASP